MTAANDDCVGRAQAALRAWRRSEESGSLTQRGRDAATLQTQIRLCCGLLADHTGIQTDKTERLVPFFTELGRVAERKLDGMAAGIDRTAVMDLLLVLEP